MMPHPERALHATLGSTDGVPLFASILESMLAEVKA
jgi:phosphoribosylformylglycinamidine (FGAM) synthase-like amidotransferase family enzyme